MNAEGAAASDYDVLIAGCGPVGATAANLLGLYGLRTLVVDREGGHYKLPRAGTCDDEAMRVWQMAGLSRDMLPHLLPQTFVQFLGRRGVPFLELHRSSFGYGFAGLTLLYQPFIEETLRRGMERYSHVELRACAELVDFEERGDHVLATILDRTSQARTEIKARYLLGCDGAHSIVREKLGAKLVGRTFQRWLVIDLAVESPQQFPPNFQFLCNPNRPAINYPMAFQHHRFQFMLNAKETPEMMEQPQIARELLAPWTDGSRVEIIRRSVYTYHARVADRWQRGRVFLAGDSAHLTPPFAGQGMSSGIRDVANLCWKLWLVLRSAAPTSILESYEIERRPHVIQMTRLALRIAALLQTRSHSLASLRDVLGKGITRIPFLGRHLTSGGFKPPARIHSGLHGASRLKRRCGWLLPQPLVSWRTERLLLDDLLGAGFAVLGMNVDPRPLVQGDHAVWQRLSTRFLEVRAPSAGHDTAPPEGVAIDFEGRLVRWFRDRQANVAVVRADRFVFGLYARTEAHLALQDIVRAFG